MFDLPQQRGKMRDHVMTLILREIERFGTDKANTAIEAGHVHRATVVRQHTRDADRPRQILTKADDALQCVSGPVRIGYEQAGGVHAALKQDRITEWCAVVVFPGRAEEWGLSHPP